MIDIKHNVITNKSNLQEPNLLEELNLGEVVGGGGAAGLSEPLPHYTVILFCDQKYPQP